MTDPGAAQRLDGRAREAWTLMVHPHEPMPPFAALDYMLDGMDGAGANCEACGAALCRAAAEWLHAKKPRTTNRLYLQRDAGSVTAYINAGQPGNAHAELTVLTTEAGRCINLTTISDAARREAMQWYWWTTKVRSKLELLHNFCDLCKPPAPRK